MSALPPKADMCGATSNVRFGPETDITGVSLFDQLVCELLEMKRYLLPQRFGGLEVDNKLILRRRLYRHVGWLLALQDTVNVAGGAAIQVGSIRAIR